MSEQFVVDKIKITQVSYAEYTDYDFVEPATFFVMDAMQNYTFVHTSKREVAQRIADEIYGVGMYVVKASKIQKTKRDITAR
jgi:hypothetical protein